MRPGRISLPVPAIPPNQEHPGRVEGSTIGLIGIGVTVGLAVAGVIGGLLSKSLGRNIKAMDKKLDELTSEVAHLRAENSALREKAVTDTECLACRRECREGFTAWMSRFEGKMDNLLLLTANSNNGIVGARP